MLGIFPLARHEFHLFLVLGVLLGYLSTAAAQTKPAPGPEVQVPLIEAADLARRMGAGKVLIFDVREAAEYAVSRVPGAVRVDPETSRRTFVAAIAKKAKGATVVFYCTAGGRSVTFAQGVYHDLMDKGVGDVFVLKGGIFAWHDENRALVDKKGTTRFIHPYDDEMKKHLKRPALARTEPRV